MKKTTLFIILFITSLSVFAGKAKINITTAPDAQIYVNGTLNGTGSTTIVIGKDETVNVRVKKVGYITQEFNFKNDGVTKLPKSKYIAFGDEQKDLSYDNSTSTDIANKDIDIATALPENDAWKLISQIVSSHFDIIDVTDRNSGYLRTAWVIKRYGTVTVRTRLIVKMGNSNPLLYKVKLVSERTEDPNAGAKDDDKFQEWDRLLRIYENIVPELQSRLGK